MDQIKPFKKTTNRSRGRVILLCVVFLFSLVGGIWLDLIYHWTGYSNFASPLTTAQLIERQKTIWDWLDLLLIPLVLAGGGLWFSWAERRNDQAIAERRTDRERRVAEDNAQEAALQAYLEQMSTLLIDKQLLKSAQGDEVQAVARAWTLTILRRLTNGERKGVLLRFLLESTLIHKEDNIITLTGADLAGVNLRGSDLTGANLGGANLEEANLMKADLTAADLREVNLEGADLREAYLGGADLRKAHLWNVNLHKANLEGANLEGVRLGAIYLRGANLVGTNLQGIDLEGIDLIDAKYSRSTKWPKNFDPKEAGAILIEE